MVVTLFLILKTGTWNWTHYLIIQNAFFLISGSMLKIILYFCKVYIKQYNT